MESFTQSIPYYTNDMKDDSYSIFSYKSLQKKKKTKQKKNSLELFLEIILYIFSLFLLYGEC